MVVSLLGSYLASLFENFIKNELGHQAEPCLLEGEIVEVGNFLLRDTRVLSINNLNEIVDLNVPFPVLMDKCMRICHITQFKEGVEDSVLWIH